MALIVPGFTSCAICGEVIDADDEVLGFPDYVGWDYWRLADGAVHRPCFAGWDQRHDFIRTFNSLGFRYTLDEFGHTHWAEDSHEH